MPSDANGVYSLPSGYLAVTGQTIQASQHNPPLEDIATALTARMMRSGVAPMTGPLKIVDGTVGSPAVQFANASSTGIYKTTNGIGVSIFGTQVAEFTSGGLRKGGHFLGELIPYSGLTAQSLTVLPYGQTLSRTTYADLWAFAQVEIAAGNTFYNNGDGSTTFGIGDCRGRVFAGWDKMGGTAANRLTTAGSGVDGSTVGAVGGLETHELTEDENGPHDHGGETGATAANLTLTGIAETNQILATNNTALNGGADHIQLNGASGNSVVTSKSHVHVIQSSGMGEAHNNVQPTLVCNFLLFAGA